MISNGEIYRLVENPAAYFIEYNDGLRATPSDAQRRGPPITVSPRN